MGRADRDPARDLFFLIHLIYLTMSEIVSSLAPCAYDSEPVETCFLPIFMD
jgi:hypothetical protein